MEKVIFIPIKENSQRVPRKNFREFNGVSLYKHTLYKFKDFKIYVDTDSNEIIDEVKSDEKLRHVVAYLRPKELIGDKISVNFLINNFINFMNFRNKNLTITQIHVTNPFLKVETVEIAINTIENEFYDSVSGANRIQARLWRVDDKGGYQIMTPINHNPEKLEQTQDLAPIYQENSTFYSFTIDSFLKNNNRVGKNPCFQEVNFPENLDIDEEKDWDLVTKIIKLNFEI